MGYTPWRQALLLLLAVLWIGLSYGIYSQMINSGMGAVWQVAVAISGWWIVYLGIARVLYNDDGY